MLQRVALTLALITVLVEPAHAAPRAPADVRLPQGARIERIEARLIYETSGALSDNIAPPARFALWNTIIAGGDAKEPARDVLVSATLVSPSEEANLKLPLILTARLKNGRVIARRTVQNVLIKQHRASEGLLLQDATCLGQVSIEARYGAQRTTTSIDFDCGE